MTAAKWYRSWISSAVRAAGIGVLVLTALLLSVGRADNADDASKQEADSRQQPPLLRLLRESRAPYQTFATRFVQRKRLAMLDVTLESEGMIFFRRPGSIRYEILAPVQSLLMYDGRKVRCYAFSEGEWKLLNNPGATAVGQVLRQIGRWIQGEFDTDGKMFEIEVIRGEDDGGAIHLVPRSEAFREYIQRIIIHVEKAPDYRVTRVTIRESDVDVTEMRFRRELRNPPIPEGTFSSPEASQACQAVFPPERSDPNDPNEPEEAES